MAREILLRINIPPRLQDEMLLKTAGYFDVPNTPEGVEFQQWWEKAASNDRDALMRKAYTNNVSLLDALYGSEDE